MGAYLSSPSTETKSEDFTDSEKFAYGVSRMQGWRISMEDAHNCVPNVTDDNSLFGVYDGHGGSEVALYCALHLSNTLKDLASYQDGKYETALKETFMALDKELLKPEVVRELKVLADRDLEDAPPTKEDIENMEAIRQDEEECEEDEMAMLHEEATMSIEELLSRYGKIASATNRVLSKEKSLKSEATSSSQSNEKAEPSCGSSSSVSVAEDPVASSSSDEKVQSVPAEEIEETGGSSNIAKELQSKSCGVDVSPNSMEKQPGSSNRDNASMSSSSKEDSDCTSQSQSDQPCPLSSGNTLSSDVSKSNDTEPKKSVADDNLHKIPEQSNEISSSDSAKDYSSSDNSSGTGSCSSSEASKKVKSGKINPKAKTRVKFGIGDDGDFEPELSGSESEDDGFDSDEAVEGSSESEEDESEEEESDDENPDDVEIPPLKSIVSTKEEPGKDSGTTAVVALLHKYDLFVANAGDSRCVICRNGTAFDMSDDHKPEDPLELSRIKAAGGYVAAGRVNGGLNLSRAIGDHCYKLNENFDLESQIISAMPDIKKVTLNKGDQFMILACDGIWNTLSSQDAVDFVLAKLASFKSDEKAKLSSICEGLMTKCLAPDTSGDGTGCDNMTCIIVKFDEDWLTKSPFPENNIDDQTALVNVKSEDGSGEAVRNQDKANGVNDTEDMKAVHCLKRHLDDTSNCDYSNSEAKVQKVE